MVRLSALRTGPLYPQGNIHGIHICIHIFVRTRIEPRATVQPEGLKRYLYLHFTIHDCSGLSLQCNSQVYHSSTILRFITSVQFSGLSLQCNSQVYHFSTILRFITSVQFSGLSLQCISQVYHFSAILRFIT
jgi:hypothetical protein